MKHRKILFIAYLYPPAGGKALPGVQRVVKFIKYLSSVDKYVLTLKPDLYPDFFSLDHTFCLPVNNEHIIRTRDLKLFNALIAIRNFALMRKSKTRVINGSYDFPGTTKANNETENSVEVDGTWKTIKDVVSEILTFPDYASGWIIPALLKGRRVIIQERIDVVFATGMPWSSLLVGAGLKKMTGVKLITDFRDPWATNPFAREKSKFIKKLKLRAERTVVNIADCVTLNTPELTDEFKKRYTKCPTDKFVTLYNGYDPEIFEIEPEESVETYSSKLIISHVGYLYGLRDPRPLLDALAIAKRRSVKWGSNIIFQQIGFADLGYDLESYADALGIKKNFAKLSHLPLSEALSHMHKSDILVIIQPQTTTQIPSKIYEYIFFNKPIIAIGSRDGAVSNLMYRYGFGTVFLGHEVEKLADFLIHKAKEKKQYGRVRVKYNNRELFDMKHISGQLKRIIDTICS